jgi:hypothetical protein
MTSGIEQNVALPVPDERAADWKIDRLISLCPGDVDTLFHPETPGGEKIQLHDFFSARLAAALRIAATMFW